MKPTKVEEIEIMLMEDIPDDAAFNSDIEDWSDNDDFDPLDYSVEHSASAPVEEFDIENMGML